jgi:hypothetical protein
MPPVPLAPVLPATPLVPATPLAPPVPPLPLVLPAPALLPPHAKAKAARKPTMERATASGAVLDGTKTSWAEEGGRF